ncbi:MAG TPA: hypothetical protein VKQ72_15745, partial [Aggregatilineales bacterium]|nr:hypothetical protein [Aggregatilineales bacterium]
HSIANLFEYIRDDRYSFVGWLLTAGLLLTVWRLWNSHLRDFATVVLVIFYVPFFVIWWALFSYDGRFLLAVIAPISVMAAEVVLEVFRRIAPVERFMWLRYAAILFAFMAIPAATAAVDNKLELVKNPFMSDIDKHRVRLGTDRYNLDLFLRTLPAGTRVRTIDILLPYNADNIVPTIDWVPNSPADLAGQDYWVISPGETLPTWSATATPVFSEGAYRLFAVSHN